MKAHDMVGLDMDREEFNRHLDRLWRLLEPVVDESTAVQLVCLLQYTTGMVMAAAGCVFPEHPLHPQLQALTDGFNEWLERNAQDADK